ncbi:MAG: transcriptional repressor [Acidimicrobiales bacterium]
MVGHAAPGLDVSEIHEVAVARLGHLDQRYTANRKTIVAALASSDTPLTIGELLDTDGGLSQSSTYRNLAVLEEAGVVHRIVTAADHARFELTEDVTGTHHHHLVCTGCGIVLDVTLPDPVEEQLHAALSAAAAAEGFTGAHHRVDLVGTCRTCTPAP